MSPDQLFSIPIPTTGGNITCTSPTQQIYLLTFTSAPDNRLTSSFIDAFLLALDIIEETLEPGVVITTSGIPKFYSNGLDLDHAMSTPLFFEEKLNKLCDRIMTYPMPTVALLNGHAFAGGFMVATFHDYRIQNPDRGFVCLNEIDFGAAIPTAMLSIFREKVTSGTVFRSIALEGKRFGGKEALAAELVDGLGDLSVAIKFVQDRNLVKKANTGPWGVMKEDMYRETLAFLRKPKEVDAWKAEMQDARERADDSRGIRIAQWEKDNGKAKL